MTGTLQVAFSGPHPYAGWMGPSPDSEVILGVVASDTKFVARAYRDWCEELGLNLVAPTCRVSRERRRRGREGVYGSCGIMTGDVTKCSAMPFTL